MKNIVLLSSTFLPDIGGVQIGLHNIALNLIKKKYNPILLVPFSFKYRLKNNINLPYRVDFLPPKILTINKFFPKLSFIILSIFFFYYNLKNSVYFWHITVAYPLGVSFIYYAKNFSVKNYLIRSVGEDIQINKAIKYGYRLDQKINKLILNYLPKSQNLIAISETIKNEYLKIGVKNYQIHNIPNGVDTKLFNTNYNKKFLKKKFNIPENKFIFLAVGRYHSKKNFELLVYAAQKLIQNNIKDFIIIIYGIEIKVLKKIINKLNLNNFFLLINQSKNLNNISMPDKELIKYYLLSDAFLFPSLIESFGIVLIEAMAAKLPTISFNTTGPKQITDNGKFGILAKYNNVNDFTFFMKKMMLDKKYRRKYSDLSYLRVKNYEWSNIVDSYIKLYES